MEPFTESSPVVNDNYSRIAAKNKLFPDPTFPVIP